MKKLLWLSFIFPVVVLAQDNSVDPEPLIPVMPDADQLGKLLDSIGNLKGSGALVIAAFIVQVILAVMKSKLGKFAGKYQLLSVYGLSIVAGVLLLVMNGVDLGAALVHANTLAMAQVFFNQIYKQFVDKKI